MSQELSWKDRCTEACWEKSTEACWEQSPQQKDGEHPYWVLRGAAEFEDVLRRMLQTATQQRTDDTISRKNREMSEGVT